jgi:hypothetical protein
MTFVGAICSSLQALAPIHRRRVDAVASAPAGKSSRVLPKYEIASRPAMRPNTSARRTETALGAVPQKCPVISPAA